MKRVLILFIISFIGFNGISQQKELKDLVGRWEIVGDKDNSISLEVVDSSNIILGYNGERKKIRDYKIDFTKSPIWFDFSTIGDSASMVNVQSLIEIVGDHMIKWQLFVDEERTPYFTTTKGELFFLRKTKDTGITGVVAN
jgi:hypothetical protein